MIPSWTPASKVSGKFGSSGMLLTKSTLIAFIRLLEYRLQRALAELDVAWSTYLPYRLQTAENMEPFVLKSFYDIGEHGNVYSTASQGL